MSNAFASALEISAKILRDHLADPTTARRLIAERLQSVDENAQRQDNRYLDDMREGFKAVLAGLYGIAKRGER